MPRVNEPGAFWGLMLGLLVGLIRFGLEVGYGNPKCYEVDTRPWVLKHVHYLHFGIFLFLFSSLVTFLVSLVTPPIPPEKLARLTFWTRYAPLPRKYTAKVYSVDAGPTTAAQQQGDATTVGAEFYHGSEHDPTELPSLDEGRLTRRFLDACAIAVMAITVFVYAFFA